MRRLRNEGNRGQIGVKAHTLCWGHNPAGPMNSGFSGRWDGNRTCNLRFWSLPPFIQQCSGTYTSGLESAHFDGPKYQNVYLSSPALGSTLGSKQPVILLSTGCHLGRSYQEAK